MDEGYRFVNLPANVYRIPRPHAQHGRKDRDLFSGRLEITFAAEQPVHIGSGFKALIDDKVVRCGVLVNGNPGVPGSSMKGTLRGRFEAITRSCAGQAPKDGQIRSSTGINKAQFTEDVKSHPAFRKCDAQRMCATCALFGRMSLRSRIMVLDFEADQVFGTEGMLEQFSPNAHHLCKTREIVTQDGEEKFRVSGLRGRKFGMHLGPIPDNQKRKWQRVQTIPKGALIRGAVLLANVRPEELGGLLVALGRYPESVLKIGAGKGNARENAAEHDASFGRIKLVELGWTNRAGKPMVQEERALYNAFAKSPDRWGDGERDLVAIHQGAC